MTSRLLAPMSPPSWGFSRIQPGGLALVALWALLWALFLGTVGRAPPPAPAGAPEAAITYAR